MTTMIERMARAAAIFDGRPFETMGRVDRERYLARAMAELAAIREPTAAMVEAGWMLSEEMTPTRVWQAMHAAILEEQGEGK